MSDSEEEIYLASNAVKYFIAKIATRKRNFCAHPINRRRYLFGEFHHLYKQLREHPAKFIEYMRMKMETFDYIHSQISDKIEKQWRNCHSRPILSEERLMITLR